MTFEEQYVEAVKQQRNSEVAVQVYRSRLEEKLAVLREQHAQLLELKATITVPAVQKVLESVVPEQIDETRVESYEYLKELRDNYDKLISELEKLGQEMLPH